ncbi:MULTISPECIES: alpha/beta hydrolase [Rhodopseudomonas]|uniref:Alpha/beta hydrolase n=1 Tax=Rhodopseudomonas palustris TaxID=1076 RepID=A0A0D7EI90_RHOPL|nr:MULTISPECIES: alpha/beta hydrolase [Rhodopseudomonas]KIZ40225.1 alpha/beta hydrolase [Rhodopseudomonas palustris]MDF3808896.1 alpha/beta hydrolase [Rhodopseudomonas sp. BAL398]WOK15805.1 alpha/beta hydrolase [Rhodopseudomonas sp. BAL398]
MRPLQMLRAIGLGLALAFAVLPPAPAAAQAPESRFAEVPGVKLHYLIAGQGGVLAGVPATGPVAGKIAGQVGAEVPAKGDPVLLLHGFAETSQMWRPLIAKLAEDHTVIAPDLRGFGGSGAPPDGYTKAAMARDIHALLQSLKIDRIKIVGHDIGLMVAYAYAAQYPAEVERIALMDAFLPGIGDWTHVWLLSDMWHFHFYGKTPLALVEGRERIYLDHFWNDFAADPKKSVPESDRVFYTKAYARPGYMAASFEVFHAFEQDAKDFAGFAKTKLRMPMLVLSGEKAGGQFLIKQGRMVATNVEGVIVTGSGHWLIEEAPDQVIPKLVSFLKR